MNIGFHVYFTYLCTNQSVQCDISGISKDRKFSCPKLGCRTGENWEKNFPINTMRISVVILIFGFCAVGYSRPSKSKLKVFLSSDRFSQLISHTLQINVLICRQGPLVMTLLLYHRSSRKFF